MTERILGPYKIESTLGSGRLGTLHTATVVAPGGALALGRTVVVKILDRRIMDSLEVRQLFLEDALPARMVRHPNVVRTYDLAVAEENDDATFFVVMEPVRGKTARAVQDALGRVSESLLRVFALSAVAGLAAVHAHEILHLNITPDNLIVTDDHRVRVMDIGIGALRAAIGHERLEGGCTSAAYAAPEQLRLEQATLDGADTMETNAAAWSVGPGTDLYSLGIVLYELATGTHPFGGIDDEAFREAHLKTVPDFADERALDLSPFFSEVLATLLRKDPARRFPSAAALHALLQQGESSDWWREREAELRAAGRLPRPVRIPAQTPLVGRETEMRVLRERYRQACEGDGQAILIEGVAGVGKSRLLREFAAEFDAGACHVLHGTYRVRGGRGGLSQAVVRHLGLGSLEDELRRLLPLTPDLVPGLVSSFSFPDLPTGGARPPVGDALHSVFVHLMHSLADEKPVVWILDDLQFASRQSISLMHSLVRAVQGRRILLVVTGRPGLQATTLGRVEQVAHFHRMPLGPLSLEAVSGLLTSLVGPELAVRMRGEVGPRSGGVPFFVLEMIAELKQRGVLFPATPGEPAGGMTANPSLDVILGTLQTEGLIERRLSDLPASHRSLLDVAAVQGTAFDPELVASAMGTTTVSALLRLAEIEHNLGIVSLSGARCEFTHHIIHEEIERALPRAIRSEYHALLADAIRARGRSPIDGSERHTPGAIVGLAHHGLRGSRPLDAGPYVAEAMDHLWHAHRNPQAVEIGETALAVPKLLEGRARLDVLVRLARSLEILDEFASHAAVVDEALEVAAGLDDPLARARILRLRGIREAQQGDHETAIATFEDARAMALEHGDRYFEAQLREHLGKSTLALNRLDQASAHFERFLQVIRETKDDRRQGETLANLAKVAYKLGHLKVARAQYDRALQHLRKAGDSSTVVRALSGFASVLLRLGELDAARDTLRSHLDLVRRLGLRTQEPFSRINLAALYMAYGEPGRARDHLGAHLSLARELGDARMEAVAMANLGSAYITLGNVDAAKQWLLPALDTFKEMERPGWEAFVVHELGRLNENTGELEAAQKLYREALGLRRKSEQQAEVAQSLLGLARIALAQGKDADARWSAEEAFALAQEFDAVGEQMVAAAYLALLGGLDKRTALEIVAKSTRRATFDQKLETAYFLWRANGDPAQLHEAHNLLQSFRAKVQKDETGELVDGVLLHRWIQSAWDARSPKTDSSA